MDRKFISQVSVVRNTKCANNSGCSFAPAYMTAVSNNTLTALIPCMKLEKIFSYYMTITIDFILITSRHNGNYFIILKFDSG